MSAPVSAWVVDTGNPSRVARRTVTAAPSAAAPSSDGGMAVMNRPLAEKVAMSPADSALARNAPSSVVPSAHARATR